jgi:hypothetical protein
MSWHNLTTTVHRLPNGTITYPEAYHFDTWLKKNAGAIRLRISEIHDADPYMRTFSMERVGPLVYRLYEQGFCQ